MNTPWQKKPTPAYVEQERRQGKRPGARLQINSGRIWHSLRDVVERSVIGHLLIDNKTGRSGPLNSYRITKEEWRQLKRDANRTPPGCFPVLRLDIGFYRLMVIEEDMWDEIGKVMEWSKEDTTKP